MREWGGINGRDMRGGMREWREREKERGRCRGDRLDRMERYERMGRY